MYICCVLERYYTYIYYCTTGWPLSNNYLSYISFKIPSLCKYTFLPATMKTDMTKIIVVIRTLANAPKNVSIFYGSCFGLYVIPKCLQHCSDNTWRRNTVLKKDAVPYSHCNEDVTWLNDGRCDGDDEASCSRRGTALLKWVTVEETDKNSFDLAHKRDSRRPASETRAMWDVRDIGR